MEKNSQNRKPHPLIEELLASDSVAGLAAAAAEDPRLAAEIRGELLFSEMIRQALRPAEPSASGDLLRRLDEGVPGPEALLDLALDGEADPRDFDRLARGLLDEPASAREARIRLAEDEWLRQSLVPNKSGDAFVEALETRMWAETSRDRFLEDLEAKLRAVEADREREESPDSDREIPEAVPFPRRRAASWGTIAAQLGGLAAAVAVGAFVAVTLVAGPAPVPGSTDTAEADRAVVPDPAEVVATVVKSSRDAAWLGGAPADESSPLAAGSYELESGLVSLRFRNGNEITVQAPAKFELSDESEASILSGLALARSDSPDLGFALQSKGMVFSHGGNLVGIDAREEDSTQAVVFSGDAGVCLGADGKCRDLFALEAVKTEAGTERLLDVPYNPRPFEQAWELVAGVEKNFGQVSIQMPGAERRPSPGDPSGLQVFLESESFEASGPIEVDRIETGHFADARTNPGQALQAEGRLRSYLLELWPEADADDGRGGGAIGEFAGEIPEFRGGVVEASLTFDHEIVGVIFSPDRLERSDKVVGSRVDHVGVEEVRERGLDPEGDWILLSDDRRTVNLRLTGGDKIEQRLNQVRVLVALQ